MRHAVLYDLNHCTTCYCTFLRVLPLLATIHSFCPKISKNIKEKESTFDLPIHDHIRDSQLCSPLGLPYEQQLCCSLPQPYQ